MSNLAFKHSFSPVFSEDDDVEFEGDVRALPRVSGILRGLSVCALSLAALVVTLGALLAGGQDPVFGAPVLNTGLVHENNSTGTNGLAMLHVDLAIALGVVVFALTIGTLVRDGRRWVRVLALGVFALCVAQLLGREFLAEGGVALAFLHPFVGQLLFPLLALLAYAHSRELIQRLSTVVEPSASPLFLPSIFVGGFILLQLVSGALVRVVDAGLAIPDFPTVGGGILPLLTESRMEQVNSLRADSGLEPVSFEQALIHLAHRIGALVLAIGGLILGARVLQDREFSSSSTRTWALVLVVGIALQVILGGLLVWSLLDPLPISVHLLLSVGCLTASVMVSVRLRFQV